MINVIETAAYDAKLVDSSSLGLPDDVTKLKQAIEDKKTLKQIRKDASTESERKGLNKEIIDLTKALSIMRNDKIEWHSHLKMELSQLCDRRND
jgi:hypothetical protein